MRVLKSRFVKSATKQKEYTDIDFSEIAFVGKSNVGKSSLINRILERKLIAKVSSTPGKTRLINFFEAKLEKNDFTNCFLSLVDLPGYGYTKVKPSFNWEKMIVDYFNDRKQLKAVFFLSDIRHGLNQRDKLMIDMIRDIKLPFYHVLTKADKLPKNRVKKVVYDSVITTNKSHFSALRRVGIAPIYKWLEDVVLV